MEIAWCLALGGTLVMHLVQSLGGMLVMHLVQSLGGMLVMHLVQAALNATGGVPGSKAVWEHKRFP